MTNEKTPEQEARDLLERLSDCRAYADPQTMSSGDIVELANLIREVRRLRRALEPGGEPEPECMNPLPVNLEILDSIVRFAYTNGYHELGYDIVAEVREQCRNGVPASEAYSGCEPDLSRDRGPPGPGEVLTSPVLSRDRLRQVLEDLNFPSLTILAHAKEEAGEQRIPCFLQIDWVERAAKALGYAYPPVNRQAEPTGEPAFTHSDYGLPADQRIGHLDSEPKAEHLCAHTFSWRRGPYYECTTCGLLTEDGAQHQNREGSRK